MKKQGYRRIVGLLLLGWMLVIFWFSAQPATESTEMSGGVAQRILETYDKIFDTNMPEGELVLWATRIDYPIRKLAHMSEYAVLAIFFGAYLMGYRQWGKRTAYGSLVLSVCYAATDEIHQLFVPGRAGRFSDVCIDTAGAIIGVCFLAIVMKLVRSHCAKKRIPLE